MRPSDISLDFTRLRVLRNDHGMSQVEAARRIGITKQRLCNYEQGLFAPSAEMLARLLALYGAGIEDVRAEQVAA